MPPSRSCSVIGQTEHHMTARLAGVSADFYQVLTHRRACTTLARNHGVFFGELREMVRSFWSAVASSLRIAAMPCTSRFNRGSGLAVGAALSFATLLNACASYEPTDSERRILAGAARPPSKELLRPVIADALHSHQRFFDPESLVIDIRYAKKTLTPEYVGFARAKGGMKATAAGWFVCGFYNAKNRLGGYVGERPFSALLDHEEPNTIVEVNAITGSGCGLPDDYAVEVVDLVRGDF